MAGCSGNCESCSSNCGKEKNDFHEPINKNSSVKHVIGVVSGKGGVGKSMVTVSLAVLMNRKGYNVGILDADITGPSIPKMFGITQRAKSNGEEILPEITANGIEIMSTNLLLETEETPVVWRGPVIAGAVKQFWTEVRWGDLDYMFIDMPPGTGDVPLTVYQSLKLDGVVIVTSPQDLVSMIVKKAFNMANMMNVPTIGIVENMSYLVCPDCNKRIALFGEENGLDEAARRMNIELLAKLPIDPTVSALCDSGEIERVVCDEIAPAVDAVEALLK